MITLYTWTTADGRKASIMLEEIGARYTVKPVNIFNNEQFAPDYLKISPNNKIPAIVDDDAPGAPRIVFESGAILIYLAERSGMLLPQSGPRRDETLKWLFWGATGASPMIGQWNYFTQRAPDKIPAAIDRFGRELMRLMRVLDKRLQEEPFLAGDYSIADIGCYSRIRSALPSLRKTFGAELEATPNVDRWIEAIGNRPAVQRGMAVPKI